MSFRSGTTARPAPATTPVRTAARRAALALGVIALAARPAAPAVISDDHDPVDQIATTLAMGVESASFGNHVVPEPGQISYAITPYLGLTGEEYNGTIVTGIGLSVRTDRWLPFPVGASAGVMSSDLGSWFAAVSAQQSLHRGRYADLVVEGVAAYQRSTGGGEQLAVYPDRRGPTPGSGPLPVIVEGMQAGHLLVHLVYRLRLGPLEPLVDVGAISTAYRLHGYECDYGIGCADRTRARTATGAAFRISGGAGATIRFGQAHVFGGMKLTDFGGGIMVASIGSRF